MFGVDHEHHPVIIQIQEEGRVVTVFNIETISENVAKIDSETAVSFAIEEVPLAAARKMLADVEPGEPAFIALEYSKPVPDAVARVIGDFVKTRIGVYTTI